MEAERIERQIRNEDLTTRILEQDLENKISQHELIQTELNLKRVKLEYIKLKSKYLNDAKKGT